MADVRRSVQPEWCLGLPLQQQSVLLLAARGPDGVEKVNPCKSIVQAYRGEVLVAAKYGRPLEYGEPADTFMSLAHYLDWDRTLARFFSHADALPFHYTMHLAHGAEIIGYKHPDARVRGHWREFYELVCAEMLHVAPEPEGVMDARLSDWDREHWGDAATATA